MLSGLDHLNLAVRDLQLSFDFYKSVLNFRAKAKWSSGAYLSLGELWLCLSVDAHKAVGPATQYTHYAFSIAQEDYETFVLHARSHGVIEWKVNKSEGDSFYFLDPDGHKLEAHVGSLETRLRECRELPYSDMEFFE